MMTNNDIKIKIRTFNLNDIPKSVVLERDNFDFPWTEKDFKQSHSSSMIASMAAEIDKELAGYLFYDVAKDHYQILSINVDKKFQRKGVGTKLVETLISRLNDSYHKNTITASVRETNVTACLFFNNLKFNAVEIIKDAYTSVHEDAYVMKYRIPIQELMEKFNK